MPALPVGTPVERVNPSDEVKPRFRDGTPAVILEALGEEGARGYNVRLHDGITAFWAENRLRERPATIADLAATA